MVKYPANAHDPYVDQKSGVLKNRLGIVDNAILPRVEASLTFLRSYEMARTPVQGAFDLAHLQAIHKRLFGDIYDWAGQIRTVDISKGNTRFASFQQIESYAPEITRPLQREKYLRSLDIDMFCQRAGHYLGELNVLHPFREGNGRSIREFISQLARDAGYALNWTGIEQAEMIQASIEAYQGDASHLARIIRNRITDLGQERGLNT